MTKHALNGSFDRFDRHPYLGVRLPQNLIDKLAGVGGGLDERYRGGDFHIEGHAYPIHFRNNQDARVGIPNVELGKIKKSPAEYRHSRWTSVCHGESPMYVAVSELVESVEDSIASVVRVEGDDSIQNLIKPSRGLVTFKVGSDLGLINTAWELGSWGVIKAGDCPCGGVDGVIQNGSQFIDDIKDDAAQPSKTTGVEMDPRSYFASFRIIVSERSIGALPNGRWNCGFEFSDVISGPLM